MKKDLIHVVLDTNVYRNKPKLDDSDFKAISKLSIEGSIRIHIPYIVLREFQTQRRIECLKFLNKAKSALSDLSRNLPDINIPDKLKALTKELADESENILSDAEGYISEWANSINANVHPLCIEQTKKALEAYFQGTPPLKLPKIRKDIPDSFIVQSIYKLNTENNGIHVVTDDRKVKDAFSDDSTITTHDSLESFIETPLIQSKLQDIDSVKDISLVVDAMKQHEEQISGMSDFISKNVGEDILEGILDAPFSNFYKSFDKIINYHGVGDIELDFFKIRRYGNNKFGISFQLNAIIDIAFHIDDDFYGGIEEGVNFGIGGLILITIDTPNIDLKDISKRLVYENFNLEDIAIVRNRLCGRISFDYSNNNGRFIIGRDKLKFETQWSKAGGDSIHVYNDPSSIKSLGLAIGITSISQISDASVYDMTSRVRTPQEGEIVVFKNQYGNYAAVQVVDVKDRTRNDDCDQLTFEYMINPDGGLNFS